MEYKLTKTNSMQIGRTEKFQLHASEVLFTITYIWNWPFVTCCFLLVFFVWENQPLWILRTIAFSGLKTVNFICKWQANKIVLECKITINFLIKCDTFTVVWYTPPTAKTKDHWYFGLSTLESIIKKPNCVQHYSQCCPLNLLPLALPELLQDAWKKCIFFTFSSLRVLDIKFFCCLHFIKDCII